VGSGAAEAAAQLGAGANFRPSSASLLAPTARGESRSARTLARVKRTMQVGTLRNRLVLFLGAAAGLAALVLAAANQIQNAGRATAVSLAFFVVLGLGRGYRRFGNDFWLALPKHESLRFVTVFISGIALT